MAASVTRLAVVLTRCSLTFRGTSGQLAGYGLSINASYQFRPLIKMLPDEDKTSEQ